MALTFGSLFSGIGGIDLGLERAGMECYWQVENDPWCQRVLAKHWPDVPRFGDILDTSSEHLRRVDVIAGGFPCQPVSLAGRGQAQGDSRWLWPAFARIVRDLQPRYVIVENVPGLLTAQQGGAAQEVFGDLAELGYDAEWASIPAASFGAPHLRYRVFIIAYSSSEQLRIEPGRSGWTRGSDEAQPRVYGEARPLAYSFSPRRELRPWYFTEAPRGPEPTDGRDPVAYAASQGWDPERSPDAGETTGGWTLRGPWGSSWWAVEPDVGRVAHGVPSRVDRLRGLGNAVVPQAAEWVGRLIVDQA